MEGKFNGEDKQKVIDFLNIIAEKATFDGLSLKDNIKLYGLLSFMQQELIPKIDANILEIIKVSEPEKEVKPKKASRGKK